VGGVFPFWFVCGKFVGWVWGYPLWRTRQAILDKVNKGNYRDYCPWYPQYASYFGPERLVSCNPPLVGTAEAKLKRREEKI